MTQDPDYPVCDWEYEVMCGYTRLGYEEWVANAREADELYLPKELQ